MATVAPHDEYETALVSLTRSTYSIWHQSGTFDSADPFVQACAVGFVRRLLLRQYRPPSEREGDRQRWITFHRAVLSGERRSPPLRAERERRKAVHPA